MPAVDEFSRPSNVPPFPDGDDNWAVPLGTISGLKLYLSYGVFVAAAVLVGVLVLARDRSGMAASGVSGNADLPAVTMIGLAFWLVGWFVQLTVYAFYRFALGVPIESITIGILGVESRPRDWDARTALIVTTTSLVAVAAVGGLIVLAEQFVNGTQPWPRMLSVWAAPSFGLGQSDMIWLGGAWLCWVQAICQAYPLPKSTGRVALVASVALMTQRLGESFQTHFARRTLQLVAFITALVAISSMVAFSTVTQASVSQSPAVISTNLLFLIAVALLLWISARADDIRLSILSFGPFAGWDDGAMMGGLSIQKVRPPRVSLWRRVRESVTSVRNRRQLRQVMQSERQEAMDAARLDAVLEQLHQKGRESLSSEDLAVLQRVANNLKKERELL